MPLSPTVDDVRRNLHWQLLLVGVTVIAVGLSFNMYLADDDASSPFILRLLLAVGVPSLVVGGAFLAGQERARSEGR